MSSPVETLPLSTTKIDKNTYHIEDNGVRCFLFIGSERALLVDACRGQSDSLKTLVESLTDKPLMVVITHADPDHIGYAAEFDKVHIHPMDIPRFYLNVSSELHTVPINESDIVDIGDRRFDVVFIPGHTPGSIALLDRENRVIVTGDIVSNAPVFMFGEGRDFNMYMESVIKLIGMKSAFDHIYPAHGQFPIPLEQLDKALAAAKKLLAGELSPEEHPYPFPAKMYTFDGAGFLYNP